MIHRIVRGAVIVQMADLLDIPDELRTDLHALPHNAWSKMSNVIDARMLAAKDPAARAKIEKFKAAVKELDKDLQFNEDFATVIANFERITAQKFNKPAWLSTEMQRVEPGYGR